MSYRSRSTAKALPLQGGAAFDPTARPPVRPRQNRRRRYWLALLVVVALGAAAGFAWYDWLSPGNAASPYVTAAVQRADIEDTTTALGTLEPKAFVDVGAQISGQLSKLHVDAGEMVRKGDLLAEIDATVHLARVEAGKAQLLNLKAQLADKEAQLVLARQQNDRQINLMKASATSEQALQSARAALASAEAQVNAVKAQIQNTESEIKADEANLGYTKIRAPMTGTVVSLTARQGQTLNTNQQAPIILSIADLSTMTVVAQVSEADVGRLRIGMDVYFTTLGQPDRRWQGKLRKILPTPEVLNNVVLYHALFDVPNPEGELMTQMTAQVFFVSAAAKDAIVVPVAAVKRPGGVASRGQEAGEQGPGVMRANRRADGARVRGRGAAMVQVMAADGAVASRPVTVGIANRVSVQITEGLEPGERVVVGTRRNAAAPETPRRTRRARL